MAVEATVQIITIVIIEDVDNIKLKTLIIIFK